MLPNPDPVPSFALLDQHGSEIDESVFRGQWDLVFFGFTHCPDICPLTLQVLADARRQLAEQGAEPLPRIVLVSVDPERDTPEKLAQYIGYFGDQNAGITGELDELRKLEEERAATIAEIPFLEAELDDQRERLAAASAGRPY